MNHAKVSPFIPRILILAVWSTVPFACLAQNPEILNWQAKLTFHAQKTISPQALAGIVAYAGIEQFVDAPKEWGRSGGAFGERLASGAGKSAIHGTLAFGLDSALHQDPRYFRLGSEGILRRVGHAVRGTILTRTDAGRETFSTWRFGSAYGSAFLSNLWRPARLDTPQRGVIGGTIGIGFDLARNLGSEFWPDIKKTILRRN